MVATNMIEIARGNEKGIEATSVKETVSVKKEIETGTGIEKAENGIGTEIAIERTENGEKGELIILY